MRKYNHVNHESIFFLLLALNNSCLGHATTTAKYAKANDLKIFTFVFIISKIQKKIFQEKKQQWRLSGQKKDYKK